MPRGVYKRDISPEACARRSEAQRKNQLRPEVRAKIEATREQNKEQIWWAYNNPEAREQRVASHLIAMNRPDVKQRCASHRGTHAPNHGISEQFVNTLIQENFPGVFKFTSPRKFRIHQRYPDWVCQVNGRKLLIEFFGDYWHSEEVTGVSCEEHEQERVEYFRRYGGWETLVIWYWELEDIPAMLRRIRRFLGIRDVEERS